MEAVAALGQVRYGLGAGEAGRYLSEDLDREVFEHVARILWLDMFAPWLPLRAEDIHMLRKVTQGNDVGLQLSKTAVQITCRYNYIGLSHSSLNDTSCFFRLYASSHARRGAERPKYLL